MATDDIDWNDLKYLRIIVQAGSFRAAAEITGISAATLAQRMSELEQCLGGMLLSCDTMGLQPTDFCQQVLIDVEGMHDAETSLRRRVPDARSPVRVSAGYWSSRFYARRTSARLSTIGIAIEWRADHAQVDVTQRTATLALRNARPKDPALTSKRIATVAFAVYQQRDGSRTREYRAQNSEWLCVEADTPSARWTTSQPGRVVARVSAPSLLVPLLDANVGIAVLPCFVGDDMPSLERIGNAISELQHDQWLVTRDDGRNHADVRSTIDAIAETARKEQALLCGLRPG